MLPYLAEHFGDLFGPLRLFTSTLFLAGLGTALCTVGTWIALPSLWHVLPTDQGRAHAVGADGSIGKPVGAGLIFVLIFAASAALILPLRWPYLVVLFCMLMSMAVGYLDDRSEGGWHEYHLGLFDLVVAVIAATAVCRLGQSPVWLPFVKSSILVPPSLFIAGGSVLIWVTINATNCTDGVDGLSGSLSAMALVFLGGILYGIVGHQEISAYLLVPHYPDGAQWGTLAFLMAGCLAGYLWYNCDPSQVLMGDAGSRPVGLLLGVMVLACGNPFLIVVVAGVVLVNGATGLIKVALLRVQRSHFLNKLTLLHSIRVPLFTDVRYPLHDHVRFNLGWSNARVLVRFVLIQAIGTVLLLILLLKVR